MALESFSGIWSLNTSNPTATDDISQGDDHIRGIKASIRQTFPAVSATVNVSASQLNHLSGVASNVQNQLDTHSKSLQAVISLTNTLSSSLASEISRTNTLSSSLAAEISRTNTLSASLAAAISNIDALSASINASKAYAVLSVQGALHSATTSYHTITEFDIVGLSNNLTIRTATGAIAVTNSGIYEAHFDISFSGSADTVYSFQLFQDDGSAGFKTVTETGTNGEVSNAGFTGIVSAAANSVLTIRSFADAAGDAINIDAAHFFVKRLD